MNSKNPVVGLANKIRKTAKRARKRAKSNSDLKQRRRIYQQCKQKALDNGKSFLFSIVIAAYNAEEYLPEAIESILKQSLGNSDTQIIIVDDGSKDGTRIVSEEYKKQFPENVEYYYQENAGVSAARNHGLEQVKGYFVGFLDADDCISKDTFYEVAKCSTEHEDVKVFAMRCTFFGDRKGAHPLNYICSEDRVINLDEEYYCYPLSATRSFFQYSCLENRSFNESLRFTEDSFIVHEIMLENPVFAAMSNPTYRYRKHLSDASASDDSTHNQAWYLDTIKNSHEAIFSLARKKCDSIPRFIQYAVMYDLYWRLKAKIPQEFAEDFVSSYKREIVALLRKMDDEVILSVRNADAILRLYALSLKYDCDLGELVDKMSSSPDSLMIELQSAEGGQTTIPMLNTENWGAITIDILCLSSDKKNLHLEGRIPKIRIEPEAAVLTFSNGSEHVTATVYRCPFGYLKTAFDGVVINSQLGFKVDIPLEQSTRVQAVVSLANGASQCSLLSFGKFAGLHHSFVGSSYCYLDSTLLVRLDTDRYSFLCTRKELDSAAIDQLEKNYEASLNERKGRRKWVALRQRVLEYRANHPNERIWLLSDRVTSAEDSGEVIFRYLVKHPIENVRPVFVIRDDVPDYARLQTIGEVVAAGSDEHIFTFMCADRIISSAADEWVINPIGGGYQYVKDLLRYKFVFLQHGVIKDNLSDWLHKLNKNIELFVTSARREQESVINGGYGYDEKNVILTGLPRWDSFAEYQEAPKRVIYVMPTWRQYLSSGFTWNAASAKDVTRSTASFTDSEYYQFYEGLLTDNRLLNLLEKHDYVVKFAPHPRIGESISAFTESKRVKVLKPESFAYSDAFKEMGMLITDFSSVAFNVAIMKKAIVYVQFDKDLFYREHTGKEDYYDYERDGFGPVVLTAEALIETIEHYINNNMAVEEKYAHRVDEFFYWPENGESRAEIVVRHLLLADNDSSTSSRKQHAQ